MSPTVVDAVPNDGPEDGPDGRPDGAPEHDVERFPVIVEFREDAAFTETYGFAGSQGTVYLEGQRIVPRSRDSDTVLLFMHPASTLNLMPLPVALARAGHHVLCCGSRYAKNDTALIMEKVAADLGAYVRHAREALGYRRVVLAGWSGGGSLALFYQAQAERPDVVETPAGDPYDLSRAGLDPADAVLFVAAHTGRARTLAEWIDPSVIDEDRPDRRDASLDLYAPDARHAPPYEADFVARYREAQRARARRITERVEQTLHELRTAGGAELERPFIVHRTLADPRFLDPSLEPNGRPPGRCYLGVPETVNSGPVGLARFSTLRAWLSQWSVEHSRADAVEAARRVTCPVLVVENGADDAVPPSHPRAVFEACASADTAFATIDGASHYYRDQPERLAEACTVLGDWLDARGLAPAEYPSTRHETTTR